MFDSKLELGIKLPSADGVKRVSVVFPSAAEWIEWRRKKKISQRDLGRRSFQIEPSKPEPADMMLFRKIVRTEEGETPVEIDDAEAFYVIQRLSECEVTERPEREGRVFAIKLKILRKLETVHRLRKPSMRETLDYERDRSDVIFNQYNTQDIRISFAASADFYDKLLVEVEGYEQSDKKDIPIPHKAEVLNVLLQEIRAEDEDEVKDDAGE